MKTQKNNEVRIHKSFMKVFHVLQAVMNSKEPVTARDVATAVNMTLPNVHRALLTLEEAGLVERWAGGKSYFMLSRTAAYIGGALLTSNAVAKEAYPELLVIREEHGFSSSVSMIYEGSLVNLVVVPMHSHVEDLPLQGQPYELDQWAAGFALGAWFSRFHLDERVRQFVEEASQDNVLDKVVKNGFAEKEIGDRLVELSIPVRDRTNDICAALSVFAPPAQKESAVVVTKSFADKISKRLGYGSLEMQAS